MKSFWENFKLGVTVGVIVGLVCIALYIISSSVLFDSMEVPPLKEVEPPKQDVTVDIGPSGVDIKWKDPIWNREK